MARRIERPAIFLDDEEGQALFDRLGAVLLGSGAACYVWALIPNH